MVCWLTEIKSTCYKRFSKQIAFLKYHVDIWIFEADRHYYLSLSWVFQKLRWARELIINLYN